MTDRHQWFGERESGRFRSSSLEFSFAVVGFTLRSHKRKLAVPPILGALR